MTINFEYLYFKIHTENRYFNGYFTNNTNIDDKDLSIISLCILYHNNKISRESFIKRLNNQESLKRHLNTYKSTILDKWYDDTVITNVLIQEVKETCNDLNLSIDKYLEYLNIGFSKNKNYCIDYLAFQIFKPAMNNYDKDWVTDFLNSCGIKGLKFLSFEQADRSFDLSYGFCCEDCSGDFEDYKRSQYNYFYKKDYDVTNHELVRNSLLKFKTHTKNPYDKLVNQW